MVSLDLMSLHVIFSKYFIRFNINLIFDNFFQVDLQWLNVSANKSSVILQLENNSKYSFGVAAENFNGSSGLTWGRCFYYKKSRWKVF